MKKQIVVGVLEEGTRLDFLMLLFLSLSCKNIHSSFSHNSASSNLNSSGGNSYLNGEFNSSIPPKSTELNLSCEELTKYENSELKKIMDQNNNCNDDSDCEVSSFFGDFNGGSCVSVNFIDIQKKVVL